MLHYTNQNGWNSPLELAEETVKLIRFKWKQLLIENADSGDIFAFEFPFFQSLPNEFFVYENALAKQLWDDHGACSQNANTMFYIIVQARQVTLVVDDPLCPVCRSVIEASLEFARELSLGRLELVV